MSEEIRSPSTLPAFLSLFTSTGTLVCCALPALLVSLGAGAVMAHGVASRAGYASIAAHCPATQAC